MFYCFNGYIEVEPIESSGVLVADEKKWVEKARVVQGLENIYRIDVGDIIFFRPHGFFELAEHEGKKHYVVRVSEEFILGIIKCGKNQNVEADSGSTTSSSTDSLKTE